MSAIPEDFTASVTNWKGTRTVSSSVAEVLGEASSLANDVIGKVDSAMAVMEDSGDSALAAAIAAVDELGHFSPHAIAVNYSPPDFLNPGTLKAGPLSLAIPTTKDPKGLGPIMMLLDTPPGPLFDAVAPVSQPVTFSKAPDTQSFFEPVEPLDNQVKQLGPLPPMTFKAFSAVMPLPPALRELVLPTFTPQPFPEYVTPPSLTLPTPPGPGDIQIDLDGLVKYVRIWGDEILTMVPKLGGVLVRDLVTERDLRGSYQTFRLRGCPLDDEQELDQFDWADETTRLLNQGELRQLLIDEGLSGAEMERLTLGFAVRYQVLLLELALSLGKLYFAALEARAEAQLSLAKSLTAYYNALLAQYSADADLYKLGIEQEVARMKYWEGLVQAEEAKAKANAQMAQLYVETEKVETIEADVYTAQVGAVLAQVERYKAQIEAIVATAEVAKTSLTVYRGETEAYAGLVAAYKAKFSSYAATTKSVGAQNQAAGNVAELSLAEAQGVAAQAALISSDIEVTAEQLKAQAMKLASTFEDPKLTNVIEANRAQVASAVGRVRSLQYTSDRQVSEVTNESASAYAQHATRYLSQASDAAYRASEQTLKAITSATQAAAIAQDAAGRTAAALAQGAYSAVHITAALRGSGHLGGTEGHSAALDQHISDDLSYTESKTQTVSA